MSTSSSIASTWNVSSKPSLFQKALILVAIPLVFEILFVGTLAQLHSHTRAEIARIDHRRQVSDATNALLLELFEIGILTKSDSPAVEDLQKTLDRLTSSVDRLAGLVKENPEQAQVVAATRQGLVRLTWLLEGYRAGRTNAFKSQVWMGDHSENFSEARRKTLFHMASPELMTMAQDAEQQELESAQELEIANTRWLVKVILAVGLLLSAAISLFSVWMISRGLTNRLKTMSDNAWRLASSMPLNPVVSGHDEIAYLDLVFHNMQDALNESNRREHALLENAVDIICSIDSSDNFTAINPAVFQMLGYEPDELLGRSCLSIVAEDDRSYAERMLSQIRMESTSTTFESRMVTKNGSFVDVLWSAQRSENDSNMISIIHDISEERDAERMKQEVIKMVTHDLKTPLTTIRIFLEMLEVGSLGSLSPSGRELVGSADRSAERMLTLIGDLLDIEKIKAGMMTVSLEQAQLSDVISEAYQSVAALAEQRHIRIDIRANNVSWVLDSRLIVRVLVNLMANAIKFSPANGLIVVTAEPTPKALQISVSDNGRGIPADLLHSIFEPFQQVQISDAKQKGGSGLGLAICKALVELHGGTIEARSEEMKGSTFMFTLPRAGARDARN
ncbi:MAG: ATP-binding protein [Candidatus Obscuribacterales bacterium]